MGQAALETQAAAPVEGVARIDMTSQAAHASTPRHRHLLRRQHSSGSAASVPAVDAVAPAGAIKLRLCVLKSSTLQAVWSPEPRVPPITNAHSAAPVPEAEGEAGAWNAQASAEADSGGGAAGSLAGPTRDRSEVLQACLEAWQGPVVQGQRGYLFVKVRYGRCIDRLPVADCL